MEWRSVSTLSHSKRLRFYLGRVEDPKSLGAGRRGVLFKMGQGDGRNPSMGQRGRR